MPRLPPSLSVMVKNCHSSGGGYSHRLRCAAQRRERWQPCGVTTTDRQVGNGASKNQSEPGSGV